MENVTAKPRLQRRKRRLMIVAIALPLLIALGIGYYHRLYPYGRSHCCDKQLALALYEYAEHHDGWYPRGENCPEASLSLLHRTDPELVTPNLLRGKTVLVEAVQQRLEAGELLTPETCGWHYVEGLRKDDDAALALFWDKIGLGHTGERFSRGGHYVWFVNGNMEYIPEDRWAEFLAEQEKLHSAIKR